MNNFIAAFLFGTYSVHTFYVDNFYSLSYLLLFQSMIFGYVRSFINTQLVTLSIYQQAKKVAISYFLKSLNGISWPSTL